MLRAAVIFFILGIFAMLLSLFGVAGLTPQVGEMMLAIFLVFALLSFIGSSDVERKKHESKNIQR